MTKDDPCLTSHTCQVIEFLPALQASMPTLHSPFFILSPVALHVLLSLSACRHMIAIITIGCLLGCKTKCLKAHPTSLSLPRVALAQSKHLSFIVENFGGGPYMCRALSQASMCDERCRNYFENQSKFVAISYASPLRLAFYLLKLQQLQRILLFWLLSCHLLPSASSRKCTKDN